MRASKLVQVLPARIGMSTRPSRTEIVIGRALAVCLHPYAAWRLRSTRGRLLLFGAYVGATYAVVLGGLLLTR